MNIDILVSFLSTKTTFMLKHAESDTIRKVKQIIEKKQKIKAEDQILLFKNKELIDNQTLKYYSIENKSVLNLRVKRREKSFKNSAKSYYFENFTRRMPEFLPEGYRSINDVQKMYWRQKKEKAKKRNNNWSGKVHEVTTVAVSSDNKYIVTGSDDRSIKIIDLETKVEVYHFRDAHEDRILSVAISPDNRYIVSGSSDNSIKVFDLKTKVEVYHFENAHEDRINSVAVSPDSKFIISGSKDKSIKVFDLQTKIEVHHFKSAHEELITSVAVSNNNKYIISGSWDTSIKVFDFQTKVEVYRFVNAHESWISSVAVSPDSKFIISGSADASIKVFDLQTKVEVHHFKSVHKDMMTSVAVSSDNKYIISGSGDRSIKVFDLQTKVEVHHFENAHEDLITSVAVSPDSKFIISGSEDASIKVFDLQTKVGVHHFENEGWTTSVSVSPDSKLIISGNDKSITLFDLQTKVEVYRFVNAHESWISSVAVSSDNKYIISGSSDKSIKVFDLQTKIEVHHFKSAHEEDIKSVTVSPDSKFIISGSYDKSIKVFDLQTKVEVHHFKSAHEEYINSVAVSPDNKYIISGSYDKSIKVFDLQTKVEAHHFKNAHGGWITSVAVSPDNKFIISGSQDKSIKVFDLQTKVEVHHFKTAHEGWITSVAVSPDNKYIISGSYDKSIKVFDLQTKVEVHHFKNAHESWIASVAVSPDNKYIIISGAYDKSINAFEMNIFNSIELSFSLLFFIHQLIFSCLGFYSFYQFFPDDVLLKNSSNNALWISFKDLLIFPHGWNILHLLAIFQPFDFPKIPSYPDIKVSFLVDRYNRTPLHYILAHDKIDYVSANIMIKYIINYLEDIQRRFVFEHQIVCQSLSNILPLIIAKMNPKFVDQYLKLCFCQTPVPFGEVLPTFGKNQREVAFSSSPVLQPEIKSQIFQEGDEQITFRSIMLYLNYDLGSYDVLNLISHLCYITDERIFKSPAIIYFINFLWHQAYSLMLASAFLFSLLMLLVSIHIGLGEKMLPLEIVIMFLASLFIFNEFLQIRTLGKKYLESIWNWMDLITLILIFVLFIPISNELSLNWISSWVVIVGYIRWVSYLRLFSPTRNLIQVIVSILKDMLGFIIILAFITLGFALVFLEFDREEGYSAHFYETYKLLFGDLTDDNFNLSQKLFSSLIMFLFNVVLLNLLIQIMGDSYDKTQDKKVLTDSITRLSILQEIIIFIRTFRRDKKREKGFLIVCGPLKSDEEEENPFETEWDGKINVIKKLLKQNEQIINQEVQREVKQVEKKVQERLEKLENLMIKQDEVQKGQFKQEISKVSSQIKQEIKKGNEETNSEMKEWVQKEISRMREETRRLIKSNKTEIEQAERNIIEKITSLYKSK